MHPELRRRREGTNLLPAAPWVETRIGWGGFSMVIFPIFTQQKAGSFDLEGSVDQQKSSYLLKFEILSLVLTDEVSIWNRVVFPHWYLSYRKDQIPLKRAKALCRLQVSSLNIWVTHQDVVDCIIVPNVFFFGFHPRWWNTDSWRLETFEPRKCLEMCWCNSLGLRKHKKHVNYSRSHVLISRTCFELD